MNLPENITTNISIPFIETVVAGMATTHPWAAPAWLGISQTYLFLKAMDPTIDKVMENVENNIGKITDKLVESVEFQ